MEHLDILAVISRLTFVFAKTMPDQPHEYTVRQRAADEADYVALFEAIMRDGVVERWGKHRYRYLTPGDGYRYWAMTTFLRQSRIINRAKIETAP